MNKKQLNKIVRNYQYNIAHDCWTYFKKGYCKSVDQNVKGNARHGPWIYMKHLIKYYSVSEHYFLMLLAGITNYRRSFFLSLIVLSMGTNTLHANEDDSDVVLAEKSAVERAVRDNPNLAAMQARYEALSQIPSQVGTLPDPIVNLNVMNLPTDSFNVNQEAMTQAQIGFEIKESASLIGYLDSV
jgi:hypothetical protein